MLTLYLSNKPSQLNKDLINYLNANMNSLVKMKLYIDFVIAYPQNIQSYTEKGIVNFPTMIHQNQKFVGVDRIKGFFNQFHQMHKKKQAERTENDDVTDYWSGILAKGDEEDDDDAAEQMKNKAQVAVQERQTKLNSRDPNKANRSPARTQQSQHTAQPAPAQKKANIEPSPLDVLTSMSTDGQESIDDQLMAKFFENQTETEF
jgi:hypothetical protein